MPSVYYTNLGKTVSPGNVALASDLNSVNDDVDFGFAQVEIDISNIENLSPYYSALAQKWAENPENVEVEPGKYSALHWSLKADADATQTAADRVQTGLDAASAFSDATASANSALESEAWAITPYNTPVEPGLYSALHWATVAGILDSSLAAQDGYYRFKNGIVLQWGQVVCNATPGNPTAVVFPLVFTTLFGVVTSGITTSTSNAAAWHSNKSVSGFDVRAALGAQSANWIAVGYITPP